MIISQQPIQTLCTSNLIMLVANKTFQQSNSMTALLLRFWSITKATVNLGVPRPTPETAPRFLMASANFGLLFALWSVVVRRAPNAAHSSVLLRTKSRQRIKQTSVTCTDDFGSVLPHVLFFRQIWLFFDLAGGQNLYLAGGGFWLFLQYFGGKIDRFLYI